jgi:hypothetical protein
MSSAAVPRPSRDESPCGLGMRPVSGKPRGMARRSALSGTAARAIERPPDAGRATPCGECLLRLDRDVD